MLSSSVGLEIMNSANPELNWKTVTKGRRSRKPIARSLNGFPKVGNSASPKRVGDFSGSDSDKFGEVVPGQSTGKSENVPIKKRRHLLQSPSPCPWTPSLRRHSASPPRSSPFSEDHEQHQYPSCSSHRRSSNWRLSEIDGAPKLRSGKGYDGPFLCGRTECEYNEAGDFSGIELLAAAASMDDETNNEKKEDLVAGDSLMPKAAEMTSYAAQSKVDLKNNESENSSSIMNVGVNSESFQNNSAGASLNLCGSPEDETMPKVKRQHWDLNTLMDAWGEPDDDSIAENTSNDFNVDTHTEGRHKGSMDHAVSIMGATTANNVRSNLNIEVNKSTIVSPDRICSKHPSLEELIPKESCNQATEKDAEKKNSIQVLSSNAHVENPSQVMNLDTGYVGKINTMSAAVAITQDEDSSSNLSECERTTASDSIQTGTPDTTAVVLPPCGISESAIDVQCKDTKDSKQTSELPGTDPKIHNDGTFVSSSAIADCQGHLEHAEVFANNDDNNHPREGIKMTMMADSCKSSSAAAQCDEPTISVGRIGSGIDGDDLTRFQEGYDSPYEDGELRGSFLCSWEDNEMENECVDYESDGRNGDGSDAADYPTSEVVEGGSEVSHGTQRRNLLVKRFPEGNASKTEPTKQSLRRQFVKDDSDNNEMGGKGSNAGSGTTVEQSMEMVIEENNDVMKRRPLIDRQEAVDTRMTQTDEYASKTGRGKLQSRIAAADGKNDFYIQPCRSRRFAGSYTRPERDNVSPDRYVGRYRPSSHDERQFTSWGSRRRYNSNYQVPEGRSHIRQPPEKISNGPDFHDPRQPANYLSKGIHRPLMRRSPVERDEYFPMRRRMPQTRGVSNYRTRGHYSQRGGRDFAEDFEPPLPDEPGTSVRMPRYISRRDRSFSPNSARNGHAPLPRRRSRSRSRTRSPRPWHSHRERIIGPRSEARMERMRAMPFSKPAFGSDYGDGYVSPPPRNCFSPQRNVRWIEDRPFGDNSSNNNHLRRRRSSPVRLFRRTQRFDGVGSSGRVKSDEYNFRPMIRPGRFKLDSTYDDRRGLHDGNDDGGNVVRRFRHNAPDEFEVGSNLNNDDDAPRDAPQAQGGGDREEKRAFKI